MTTVYIDNEPYVVDLRVRLVREAAGKETDNVLYYFTPEEIMSVKKADASSPTVQRRRAAHGFRDSASTTGKIARAAPVVNAESAAVQPTELAALRRAVQSAYDAGRVNVPVAALELDDPELEAAYFAGQRTRILTGEDAEESAKPVENVRIREYTEDMLREQYARDVETGWISPLSGFENYKTLYDRIQNEAVGSEAANGTLITGQVPHFMQRVIGTMVDPKILKEEHRIIRRSGVEVDAIKNAVFTPEKIGDVVVRKSGQRSVKLIGKDCVVTINPDTGELIQTNPLGG